jgi:hypothetical protein
MTAVVETGNLQPADNAIDKRQIGFYLGLSSHGAPEVMPQLIICSLIGHILNQVP